MQTHFSERHSVRPAPEQIETSLYDLIEAITEEIPSHHEIMVADVLRDMLNRAFKLTLTGRIIRLH